MAATAPRRFGLAHCDAPVLPVLDRRLSEAEAEDATVAFLRHLHGRTEPGELRGHLALVRGALELRRLARLLDGEGESATDGC
jgi:hypothetical protein